RRRLGKGSRGFVMVEGPDEPHSLIEILLCERGPRSDPSMKGAQALIEFGTPGPGGKGLRRTGLSMIAGRLCRTGLRPRSDVAEQREHEDLPAHHAPPILLVRLLGLGLESTPRLTLANFFFRP